MAQKLRALSKVTVNMLTARTLSPLKQTYAPFRLTRPADGELALSFGADATVDPPTRVEFRRRRYSNKGR